MNINLVTDAKYHNLALMKISAFYKMFGDTVYLNGVGSFDRQIGSYLFSWSEKRWCEEEGGPGIDPKIRLDDYYQESKPDYKLFNLDYSLGYTWEYCPRNCAFCCVPKMNLSKQHKSIWDFHDGRFKKICLLNNNTFSDPQWKETFEEIWEADLIVRDENGYDLRLVDEEKASALRKTKFAGYIHYAWDLMENENHVLRGLAKAPRGLVYVLVGYNTTEEEDFHRCQKINDAGHDPFVMPYNGGDKRLRAFKRFVDTRMYRKYPTLKKAWKDYKYNMQ